MKNKSYFKSGRNIIVLLVFLFLLIVIPSVSAAPPVLSTVQSGSLEILAPTFGTIPKSVDFDFYWHVFNTTKLLTNISTSCTYHLYSKFEEGEHIYTNNLVTKFTNDRDFEVSLKGANFTEVGEYCDLIECNTSTQTGGLERCFIVTTTGIDLSSSFFWLILVLVFGLVIFGYWREDYTLTILGSFALTFVGLYLLFYGIEGVKNSMVNAISIITLAVAGYVMAASGLKFVQDNYD